ncbi:hypothetical protein AC630_24990 [Bradyrhizobium sp. AS23.2]|nr:hypothetical protein AC630_24990 [Bradyrhizobium sp. AS23.2]
MIAAIVRTKRNAGITLLPFSVFAEVPLFDTTFLPLAISGYLRGLTLKRDHKCPISDRTMAATMIGSQIDVVMMNKEMMIARPKTDSVIGFLRPAK